MEAKKMNIETTTEDGRLVIALEGRIDATNAQEWERALTEAVDARGGAAPVLDAEDLEYISSAGLRVLLKLSKRLNALLAVRNVPPDVYEIFETTGFTDLLYVQKGFRKLSVEGLRVIGEGATAKVYQLDPETIVKVYHPDQGLDVVRMEQNRSRSAFVNGVPTAIAYDIVKVGDCYGAVYEMMNVYGLLPRMEDDREHLDETVRKFAATVREMNHIEVNREKFPPIKQDILSKLPQLEGTCTREEIDKLRGLYEAAPDRSTFIHGDCHPANVMVQNGEFMFIDLMTSASGHPIFDLLPMCAFYHFSWDEETQKNNALARNFTETEQRHIWDVFLRAYLETDDEAFLRKAERQITAFAAARCLLSTIYFPGLFPPERIADFKRMVFDYVDSGLEPICF